MKATREDYNQLCAYTLQHQSPEFLHDLVEIFGILK